jgi:hypothetical protein
MSSDRVFRREPEPVFVGSGEHVGAADCTSRANATIGGLWHLMSGTGSHRPTPAGASEDALILAIDFGCIGTGADALDPEHPYRLAGQPRDIVVPVVRYHPLNPDAFGYERAQGSRQEGRARAMGLVRQYFDIGEPVRIVDGHMSAIMASTRSGMAPVTCDAMDHPHEAVELPKDNHESEIG